MSLTKLDLDCPGVSGLWCVDDQASIKFEEGTAPKLELLLAKGLISLSGLSCLPSLKEVTIDKHAELVGDVKHQLSRNPNKSVLKFF